MNDIFPFVLGTTLFSLMIIIIVFLIISTLNRANYRIFIKMLASSLFLGIGIYGYLQNSSNFSLLILIGLFFSFLGDLFLGLVKKDENRNYFLLGVASFAITHLFYSFAFSKIAPLSIAHILLLAIVYTILYFDFNSSNFDFANNKKLVVIYATLISIVGGFAIHSFSNPDNLIRLFSIGSILFFLSDFVLMHVYFYKNASKALTPIYLIFYFVGQLLIAFSIFF